MVVHEGSEVSGGRAYLNWGEWGMNHGCVGVGEVCSRRQAQKHFDKARGGAQQV